MGKVPIKNPSKGIAKTANKKAGKSAAKSVAISAEKSKPAAKKAGPKQAKTPLKPKTQIFQVYRTLSEKRNIDSLFKPLPIPDQAKDIVGAIDHLLGSTTLTAGLSYWGVMPHAVVARTGIAASVWMQLAEANPGRDAYLFNPTPAEEALYPNPVSRLYLEFSGYRQTVEQALGQEAPLRPATSFSMAPYMIATPEFWREYWSFAKDQLAKVEKKLSHELKKGLYEPQASSAILCGDSPASLIIGSLVEAFAISAQGSRFKLLKLALPNKERELNAHLRSLRQLKDAAVKAKSPWLSACWLNYRNLYVYQVNGRQWCQEHLAAITPVLKPAQ